MGNPATIPIIDPTGKAWDIPADKAPAALQSGGKLGINVVGPDNSKWLIPSDRVHEAVARGGRLMGAPPSAPTPPEMQESPMSKSETLGANLATNAANAGKFVQAAAKPVISASAPNIAEQLYKHMRGEPNELARIPGDAVATWLLMGGAGEGAEAPRSEISASDTAKTQSANSQTADAQPAQSAAPVAKPMPYIGEQEPPSQSINTDLPRVLSGEGALRRVLTGQDNANLLKIAKSRGINVTAESQLKPGIADNRIINKIIDDFSDDELDNVRSTYMESRLNRHQFGDIGPEAWKTMGMQTFFPDVKIPAAVLKRTAAATAQPASEDLTSLLQDSLKAAKQAKSQPSQ